VLDPGAGLLVVQVVPDSPAAKAGLKPFDVLATFAGKPVSSAAQLKELILNQTPGREVEIGFIRAARHETAAVQLSERKTTDAGEKQTAAKKPLAEVRIRTLSLNRLTEAAASAEEQRYRTALSFDDPDGRREIEYEGTREELRKKMDALPAGVRSRFRDNLEQAFSFEKPADAEKSAVAAKPPASPAFRIRLQPRLDGANRSFHLTLTRAGAGGEVRVFELDSTFDTLEEVTLDRLLEIEAFADELKVLAPDIREKVEATLRRIPLPKIRVQIHKSQ
jgi:hypothetical protein